MAPRRQPRTMPIRFTGSLLRAVPSGINPFDWSSRMKRLAALCVILSLGLFIGCGDDKTKSENKSPKTKTPEVKTPEVKTPEVKTPEIKTPDKTPDKTPIGPAIKKTS